MGLADPIVHVIVFCDSIFNDRAGSGRKLVALALSGVHGAYCYFNQLHQHLYQCIDITYVAS